MTFNDLWGLIFLNECARKVLAQNPEFVITEWQKDHIFFLLNVEELTFLIINISYISKFLYCWQNFDKKFMNVPFKFLSIINMLNTKKNVTIIFLHSYLIKITLRMQVFGWLIDFLSLGKFASAMVELEKGIICHFFILNQK